MTLEKLQEFYEKYNNKFPPFYRGAKAKFLDAQPLLSYFKLYETMGTDSSLKKLGMVWFADSETGYVIKIENKQAFKRCRFFYTSVFKGKHMTAQGVVKFYFDIVSDPRRVNVDEKEGVK